MNNPIQIPVGNDCVLKVHAILKDGTHIPATALQDIVATLTTQQHASTIVATYVTDDAIMIPLGADMRSGEYDVKVTAKLGSSQVAMNRKSLFSRCLYDNGIELESFEATFVVFGNGESELDELKRALQVAVEQYHNAKHEADLEKQHFIDAAENLNEVANEETQQTILAKVNALDNSPIITKIAELYAYCATRFDGVISAILPPLEVKLGEINAYLANRFAWVSDQFGNLTTYITNVKSVTDGIKTDIANLDRADTNRNIATQSVVNSQAQALAKQIDGVSETIGEFGIYGIVSNTQNKPSLTGKLFINPTFDRFVGTNELYRWENNDSEEPAYVLTIGKEPTASTTSYLLDYSTTAVIGYVEDIVKDSVKNDIAKMSQKLGTPAEGQPSTLFAAIAAGGNTDGLATEENATANKDAILGKIGTPSEGCPQTLFSALEMFNTYFNYLATDTESATYFNS